MKICKGWIADATAKEHQPLMTRGFESYDDAMECASDRAIISLISRKHDVNFICSVVYHGRKDDDLVANIDWRQNYDNDWIGDKWEESRKLHEAVDIEDDLSNEKPFSGTYFFRVKDIAVGTKVTDPNGSHSIFDKQKAKCIGSVFGFYLDDLSDGHDWWIRNDTRYEFYHDSWLEMV